MSAAEMGGLLTARWENVQLTCRHFDTSPQTFYRWLRRYDGHDLRSLESRPRRPRRVRQPTWSAALGRMVLEMRRSYPRWGKDKPAVLLHRQGCAMSVSIVGREFRGTLEEACQRHGLRLFFAAVALTQARRCGETRPTDAHRGVL